MAARIEHKTRTGCPIACSLDVIGDHWTLLIIRNMMFAGAHEYKDMLKFGEKISSSILTNRLKNLEKDGLISSVSHPMSKRRKLYYLTRKGKGLIRVMIELARWGSQNFEDYVSLFDEQRSLLDSSLEEATQWIAQQMEEWEKDNLERGCNTEATDKEMI